MSNIYEKMTELIREQETFAVATIVNYRGSVPRQIAKMIITKDQKTYGTIGGGCVEGQVVEEGILMLKQGVKGVTVKSYDLVEEEFGGVGMNCGGKIDVSIEIVEPNPRLIIIGSGHLSSAIANLSQLLGFEIIVIDPLATKDRFPESALVVPDFPETNLPNMQISSNTYIVIVTRHKDDLPALRTALKTKAEYIGLIGSRRRVLQAFRILLHEGFTQQQLNRVNAPVGLNIGAETPEEIAVSIMAEIIQRRRLGVTGSAEPMKVDASSLEAPSTSNVEM
jgi:xanthine dehydrogenase accessory factor